MARKKFDLQDWLKDKSQKVETRDGRIVHNIWEVKNAVTAKEYRTEVCALIEGEEDALVFFKNGKYLPVNAESPYDLFIITQEPELTEFELKVREILYSDKQEYSASDPESWKRASSELLDLARKELVEEQYTSDPRKTYLYKLGKAEALKDLPRWKKEQGEMELAAYGIIGGGVASQENPRVYLNGHSIDLYSLEKLPGFKED